uniref:TauD/TfdA-like domain-containing protein n=1 Tax=Amphora coffeiformis TaxID=265554 RepID=A0A7S3PC69_9STRA
MFSLGKSFVRRCPMPRAVERLGSTSILRSLSTFIDANRRKSLSTSSYDADISADVHASLVDNGSCVALEFPGEHISTRFHTSWLWSVDPNFVHPTSGQRTRSLSSLFGHKILSVSTSIEPTENLHLTPSPGCLHSTGSVYQTYNKSHDEVRQVLNIAWESDTGDRYMSSYDIEWLRSRRYDNGSLSDRQTSTQVLPSMALSRHSGLPEMNHVLLETEPREAQYHILDTLFQRGAVLLRGATPNAEDLESTVRHLALALAKRISHGHLYGDIFHVQHIPNAHNIAYTTQPLVAHQDLAYYTSPPGFQMLHCVNNAGTVGGESFLIDAMAAAAEFRSLAPDLYQVLLESEATFVKQRGDADMVFRRPHIEEDSSGTVTAVHWSPPFEGPLAIDSSKVDDYFMAYTAFERMLNDFLPSDCYLLPLSNELERQLIEYSREFTVERKLEEGDIMVFNNHRMLHGRRSFEVRMDLPTNGRHLIGCYTDLDETMNQYRLLRREHLSTLETPLYIRMMGNGSSSC